MDSSNSNSVDPLAANVCGAQDGTGKRSHKRDDCHTQQTTEDTRAPPCSISASKCKSGRAGHSNWPEPTQLYTAAQLCPERKPRPKKGSCTHKSNQASHTAAATIISQNNPRATRLVTKVLRATWPSQLIIRNRHRLADCTFERSTDASQQLIINSQLVGPHNHELYDSVLCRPEGAVTSKQLLMKHPHAYGVIRDVPVSQNKKHILGMSAFLILHGFQKSTVLLAVSLRMDQHLQHFRRIDSRHEHLR
mmetsp:Transcript_1769/g.3942  ORF Transcript_1769/g.3942 Transcript_1769/m.3942 type:complete len:249 (-) Transcript_1769:318-1064(-)